LESQFTNYLPELNGSKIKRWLEGVAFKLESRSVSLLEEGLREVAK
jgi:hypothetical protein